MPLDRLFARYDFADFNLAGADVISGAEIEPLVLLPQGAGEFAGASRAAIASGKPYLIDANTI